MSSRANRSLLAFVSQNIANTAWSFSKLGWTVRPLFEAIASASLKGCTDFPTRDLAATAWAFSTFSLRVLANTSWALSTRGLDHYPLFEAIASAAIAKITAFQ